MKGIRRIISFLLAWTMIIGMIPHMSVKAEETEPTQAVTEAIIETTISSESTKESTEEITVIETTIPEKIEMSTESLTVCEPVTMDTLSESTLARGTCGESLTWVLNKNGVLTLSGTGKTADYGTEESPWYPYRNQISNVVVENGITHLGTNLFYFCDSIIEVSLPEGLIMMDFGVFAACQKLKRIVIPKSLETVGYCAFTYCTALEEVVLQEDLKLIDNSAFAYCTNLKNITLPDGLEKIDDEAFEFSGLTYISIPAKLKTVGKNAFNGCDTLSDVYYDGSNEEWKQISIASGNDSLINATIHYNSTTEDESSGSKSGLQIYSDYPNLSIQIGSKITLAAGILENGERTDAASSITFQISDTAILQVSSTGTRDNCRYVELTGLKEGMTSVLFSDSTTGETRKIPVNVYVNNRHAYTLSTVPTQYIDKYPTNLYNVNGLYVDSYQYTVNEDQSASVSFTVYNTNYTYGTVEVYKENGDIYNIVLIDKMISSNTSIKESVWDNIGYLISDALDGDFLTYRQKTGFSKETPISVDIPKNGYLVIATDPQYSLPVAVINAADILMSAASLVGDIKNYGSQGKIFSEKLTKKLLLDQTYAALIKDGNKHTQKLWKNVGKSIFISKESIGNFANTVAKNLNELNMGEIISETAWDCGWDVGEDVVTYFMGPVDYALEIAFVIGKWENFVIQTNDFVTSIGSRLIMIQNQGGGFRSSQEIKVESDTGFGEDISLNVFEIEIENDMMNVLEAMNPELFEAISKGTKYTYNISLLKNREEIQPNGEVTVYIPIPEELTLLAHSGNTNIYRIEQDGSMTNMNALIEDDCFVFVTDHFSLYTIVSFTPVEEPLHGDFNGDGQVTSEDAVILLWHALYPQAYPLNGDCDMNRDCSVTEQDAKYLIWHTLFPLIYTL